MSLGTVGKNISAVNQIAKSQPQVLQAIQQAAAKTGVDFAYLVKKAGVESSFNPNAQAKTSSASGLYQFVRGTWLDMVNRHGADYGLTKEAAAIERGADGKLTVKDKAERERILALRNNPQIAAVMAAEFAAENTAALQAKVGGKIGATEMYMAHFLGSDGASTLLSTMKNRPNAPAAALLPQAAAANRSVFYTDGGRARTVSEIYDNFATKFDAIKVDSASAIEPAPTAAKPDLSGLADAGAPITPLQVLAVITPEDNSRFNVASIDSNSFTAPLASFYAASHKSALPTDISAAISGLTAGDNLFRAMQFAESILDANGHLSPRQDQARESA